MYHLSIIQLKITQKRHEFWCHLPSPCLGDFDIGTRSCPLLEASAESIKNQGWGWGGGRRIWPFKDCIDFEDTVMRIWTIFRQIHFFTFLSKFLWCVSMWVITKLREPYFPGHSCWSGATHWLLFTCPRLRLSDYCSCNMWLNLGCCEIWKNCWLLSVHWYRL